MKLMKVAKPQKMIQDNIESTSNEIKLKEYQKLGSTTFAKKYRHMAYEPSVLYLGGREYRIQMNFCTNPFCEWFGKEQVRFIDKPNKPSRYRIVGNKSNKSILCNQIEGYKVVSSDYMRPLSNQAIVDEITRLFDIYKVEPHEEYEFHKSDCDKQGITPFDSPNEFQKWGKNKNNSQKYKCKSCGKYTNVKPNQDECFTYHQKRNDILPEFFRFIMNHTPVVRICEILGIGASTYYRKLEWIFERCIIFLERHEKKLHDMEFDSLWLETDAFKYYVNNLRKKGNGSSPLEKEELNIPVIIVATVEKDSRYVLRSDIAYDWNITAEELSEFLNNTAEHSLYPYARRIDRYGFVKHRDQAT